MSTSCASSLVLPSLNLKIVSLCNPSKPTSLSFVSPVSSSLKLHFRPILVPTSVFQSFGALQENTSLSWDADSDITNDIGFESYGCGVLQCLSSRFVRKVSFSQGLDQEEEVLSDGDEPSFSPELKLFVGNLPFSVDSSQLATLFANAGNVEMVEVIYDKITGRSIGFEFVTMSTTEEVGRSCSTVQWLYFSGSNLRDALRVNSGPPLQRESSFSRGPRTGGTSNAENGIYVGNLSWGVDNSALESLFNEQGKVVEAKVVYDRDSGRSRGFCFVTYSSTEEVNNAIETLNGVELDGREIRISVAESRPRRQF
ncbi:hypothetical protein K2173_023641 [Erythroxylum novogranatense]|uniref:RRM domain-containing protein n=1 Tax=Erythroxylum novogranatense TaxID=1862640 RepID=A0AAV8TPC8_9ROSI|nr:hypothetical protein K2173_023641 [Erythroxylum novogranatense]